MSKFESFDETVQQALAYFDEEETLQAAYDLLTEAAPHFPGQASIVYNLRYCAAALLNQTDLALQLIQESLDSGLWWTAAYLTSDDDLESLRELPEFKRLVKLNDEKHQAAQANAKPLALPLPLPVNTEAPLPLLLSLHGNSENASESAQYWQSACSHGWHTVLLQSSQINGPNAYVWDDLELGAQEIKAHYDELTAPDSPEAGPTVVGGFSKGGEMAIWLALKEIIPLAGFIAVNPGGPYIQDVSLFQPLIENCKTLGHLRGWLIAGENDLNLPNVKALHEMLNAHGLNCQLIIAPKIAHDFPIDFDQTLKQALKTMR